MKTAVAIRHVHFEDLGSFEPVVRGAGFDLRYVEATDLPQLGLDDADLLVVLGAPIGAYEDEAYPFLLHELDLIEKRLSAEQPMIGLCLGSQLIARALGSRVFPTGGKEIGWAPLVLTESGRSGPLRHLEGLPVLHWHGDTFDLPDGCDLLASSPICRNQAFSRGPTLLGLQFHPEARLRNFESWLVGHAVEIAAAGLSPVTLREDAGSHAAKLEEQAPKLMIDWLAGLS